MSWKKVAMRITVSTAARAGVAVVIGPAAAILPLDDIGVGAAAFAHSFITDVDMGSVFDSASESTGVSGEPSPVGEPGDVSDSPERQPFIFPAPSAEDIAIGATVGTTAGAGVSAVTPAVIQAIGFGATGIAKGSIAATIHSSIGNVTAGTLFASAQSTGAVGAISWTTIGGITFLGTAVGVTAVVAVPAACYYFWPQ